MDGFLFAIILVGALAGWAWWKGYLRIGKADVQADD